MNDVFGYPGVYWSARILLMVGALATAWMLLLMLARFFRPKHILAMLRADPPKVDEIAGEFRGFKARITFGRTAALDVLENRVLIVEGSLREVVRSISEIEQALGQLRRERD